MRVSVIVNNYNYGRYLRQAVDSALAQSHRETEVIVVDDGSTDDSRAVIAGYGERIRAILQANAGQGSAFNAGFAASRGEVVLFLDADDVLLPHALEGVVAAWRPGVAKVQFPLRVIDGEGRATGGRLPKYRMPSGDLSGTVRGGGGYPSPPTSGNAFARAALDRILPMAELRLSADAYLTQACVFFGEVVSLPAALGCYRVHGANNWAADEFDAALLRRFMRSEEERTAALRELCSREGVTLAPDFLQRNPDHLQGRMASLATDPAGHPYRDRAWRLAWQGLAAAGRGRYPPSRKLLLSLWFLGVAAARGATRQRLVRMAFAPAARPAWASLFLR